jgi:hypothetical protein
MRGKKSNKSQKTAKHKSSLIRNQRSDTIRLRKAVPAYNVSLSTKERRKILNELARKRKGKGNIVGIYKGLIARMNFFGHRLSEQQTQNLANDMRYLKEKFGRRTDWSAQLHRQRKNMKSYDENKNNATTTIDPDEKDFNMDQKIGSATDRCRVSVNLAGTPFREPPAHLRKFYEIVGVDYGVNNNEYTLAIPGQPHRYFYTCNYWLDKELIDKHPHMAVTLGPKDAIRDAHNPVGLATSTGADRQTYLYKQMGAGEAWRTFIASVVRLSPPVYDIWYDEKVEKHIVLMHYVKNGDAEKIFSELHNDKNAWKAFYDLYEKESQRLEELAETKYYLYHPEVTARNMVYEDGQFMLIDWGGSAAKTKHRQGTANAPEELTLASEVHFLRDGYYPWKDQKTVRESNHSDELIIEDVPKGKELSKEILWQQPRVPPSRRKLTSSRKAKLMKIRREKYAIVPYEDC